MESPVSLGIGSIFTASEHLAAAATAAVTLSADGGAVPQTDVGGVIGAAGEEADCGEGRAGGSSWPPDSKYMTALLPRPSGHIREVDF